jgi:hypothetical protein
VERSQARFDSGLTVESDLLTAKVRMAARLQEEIRARNTLEVARAQLNTAMGVPLDSPFQLTGGLAERTFSIPAVQDIEKQALTNRPDLKRIASEEAAQRQSVRSLKFPIPFFLAESSPRLTLSLDRNPVLSSIILSVGRRLGLDGNQGTGLRLQGFGDARKDVTK